MIASGLDEKAIGDSLAGTKSRGMFGLAAASAFRAIIAKLQDASRHMTPASRRPADRAIASIEDRIRVREGRLPDITRWLEAHSA